MTMWLNFGWSLDFPDNFSNSSLTTIFGFLYKHFLSLSICYLSEFSHYFQKFLLTFSITIYLNLATLL